MALNPLPNGQAITTPDGQPTLAFSVYWQQVIGEIAAQLTSIQDQVTAIATAQATGDAAQITADAAKRNIARITSYTSPTNIISASDAGASATITIAAHTRVYAGFVDLSFPATNLTGLAYDTDYWVYYDDALLTNPSPTFIATTTQADARAGASDGKHFLGYIKTPAVAAPPTVGEGGDPPGGEKGGPLL